MEKGYDGTEGKEGGGLCAYVVPREDAIQKLQRPDGHQEGHEGVQQLGPLRGRVEVVLQHVAEDPVPGLGPVVGARGLGGGGLLGARDGRWYGC